jgi:hypothetical protein
MSFDLDECVKQSRQTGKAVQSSLCQAPGSPQRTRIIFKVSATAAAAAGSAGAGRSGSRAAILTLRGMQGQECASGPGAPPEPCWLGPWQKAPDGTKYACAAVAVDNVAVAVAVIVAAAAAAARLGN